MSAPAFDQVRQRSSKPMRTAIRSGNRRRRPRQNSWYRGSPVPSTTNVASSGDQARGRRGNQIEPLLIDHARHHPDQRTRQRGVVRRQTRCSSSARFDVRLAVERRRP